MNSNAGKLVFEKRMNLWQSYRDEIFNESIRSSSWFNDDKKIKGFVNDINNIDKTILKDFSFLNDIQLAGVALIDDDKSKMIDQTYKMLKFSFPSLNDNYLSDIKEEMTKIEDIKNYCCFLDKSGKDISLKKLENYYQIETGLKNKIQDNLDKIEHEVQIFPKVANDKLKKLSNTISKSKDMEEWRFTELLNQRIDKTLDFKVTFFVVSGLLLAFIVAAIIFVVLCLVL